MAHTPGPWMAGWGGKGITGPFTAASLKWEGKYPVTRHMRDDIYYPVAFLTMKDPDHEANARLIAAAPDLLDFAKQMREKHKPYGERQRCLSCGLDGNCCGTFLMAETVIAKAEGK